MEESNPPELQEGNDCTLESMCLESLETSPVMLPTKRKSDMPDSPQITEEKRVKLGSSIDSTQEQQSSKISEVDSTSEKKGLYPFWSESIQEKSKKLLSCTSTDCEDVVLDSWNSSAKRLLAGSWFTAKLTEVNKQSPVNSLKFCPSSLFSLPKTIDSAVGTEKEGKKSKKAKNWKKNSTKKESAGKSIMIRLYPNKSQKEELNKWFGTARWTYNQVVASLRASPRDVSQYAVVKELRNDFVNNKNSNKEENFADKPWVTKTPYHIRDSALHDVVKAYTSNLAKENNNNFIIHFKKKKAPSDSIAIHATNYKSKGVIFSRFFGKEPIKSAEKLPDKLEYDARLVRKRYGYFYLCIPKKLDKYNGPSQNKVIAFDPGVRTFCTGYDPDGIIVEVGKSDISRIYRLCNSYDKLQRKWSQPEVKHRKRYSYKKAGARIQFRIRNLVDEFHKKKMGL
jgi:putative transposase